MTTTTSERAVALFRTRHDQDPEFVVRAPGRVNLIGEHTDYNDGFVLPMAIEHAVWLAGARNDDRMVRGVSADVNGDVMVEIDHIGDRMDGWGAYVQGVVWAMHEAGATVEPLTFAIASDVPAGAGLSSSAALEMAMARGLVGAGPWDPVAAAKVGRRAENAWVGVSSGILDQLSSAAARADNALLIDCRSLAIEHVPLPDGVVVVVMDTTTRRDLLTSDYNERRAQCQAAANALGVQSLRDADVEAVETLDDALLRRRARHVVTENARTVAAAEALREADLDALGRLMAQAHASMRDDYEATGEALDAIVEVASGGPGCIGARMTGGGFAGCGVALVAADHVDAFREAVTQGFVEAMDLEPRLHVTAAADGARLMPFR